MALLGMTAVQDWIKLLLIGAIFETCRRYLGEVRSYIVDFFWVTASFEWQEPAAGMSLHPWRAMALLLTSTPVRLANVLAVVQESLS